MPRILRTRAAVIVALLVAMMPRALPGQAPAPAPADSAARADSLRHWRRQLDIGFQDAAGNSSLTVGSGTFIVERKPNNRVIFSFKLDARYGRSNGVEAVNYQSARARFDWNPRRPVSPFAGIDVVRDIIRHSTLRIQIGTGANFNVNVRDADRTWLSAGVVWDREVFSDTLPTRADFRWMLRAATQRTIGTTTRIEGLAKIQPSFRDARDYLAALEAALRVSLTRRMGFSAKIDWKRDSRPPAGVKRNDRAITAALSFAW